MSTERIDIVISEKGARTVQRDIEKIGDSADHADSALRILRRTLGLLATGIGLREIQRMVDGYTDLQNRLRLVTTSSANLKGVTDALFKSANDTRISFEATAELYSRLALSQAQLGVSQKQLITFTTRVNQAIQLSGASAQEAKAGLLQFSQGMASGTLRGDELRSVLEQLPKVADVIAKHLGITRGELRLLGRQGKITSKQIMDAFLQADYIGGQFATTVPTIGQAFVVLHNQVVRNVGDFNQQFGISEKLSKAIISLATNTETLAQAFVTISSIIATLAGPSILGKLWSLVKGLWNLLRRNPIALIVSIFVSWIANITIFNDKIDQTLEKMGISATLAQRMAGAWAGAKAYIQAAWANFPNWLANLFFDAINGATKLLEQFLNWVGDSVGDMFNVKNAHVDLSGLLIDVPKRFADAGNAAGEAFQKAYLKAVTGMDNAGVVNSNVPGGAKPPANPQAQKAAERAAKKLASDFASIQAAADPVTAALLRYRAAEDTLVKAVDAGLVTRQRALELMTKLGHAMKAQVNPIGAYADELERQNQLLGYNSDIRERLEAIHQIEKRTNSFLNGEQTQQILTLLQQNQALKAQSDVYDQIAGPQQTYIRTIQALDALLQKGRISQQQYTQAVLDAQGTMLDTVHTIQGGVASGLNEIVKTFTDSSGIIKDALTNTFSGLEDVLVDFAATGKASVSDMVDSIIKDFARIAVRQSITGPLAGALGGVLGSLLGGFGGGGTASLVGSVGSGMSASSWLPGRAGGGATAMNSAYKVNERGIPEVWSNGKQDFLLTGSQRGRVTPLSEKKGGGEVVYVEPRVNIYNNAGVHVETKQRTGSDGQPEMDVLIDQVASSLATGIQSGQSPMVGAISTKFGLTPQAGGR